MNIRQSPAVKNKIKNEMIIIFLMMGLVTFGLFFIIFVPESRKDFLSFIFLFIFLIIGLNRIYSLLNFKKLLKDIEIRNCIILAGKGNIVLKGGRYAYWVLEVEVGNEKIYESDSFSSQLKYKVGAFKGFFFAKFFSKGKVNEDLFDKVLAEDFTVYVDAQNPKNYFVDISPLYIAAEQK